MKKSQQFLFTLLVCLLIPMMSLQNYALAETSVPPSSPTNLKAIALSSSEINLTWIAAPDATSYNVYRATSSTGNYTEVATLSTNSYSDTGLLASTPYYYKVKSYNSSGFSGFSSMAWVNTSVPTGVPDIPINLKAEVVSFSEIDLTWETTEDASSYYVYRAVSSNGAYSKIATVKTTSYSNTGITASHTYYYKVQAYNSKYGASSYSTEVSVSTPAAPSVPSAPSNLTATASSSSVIDLQWNSDANATSYSIYRAASSDGTYSNVATASTNSYSDTGLLASTTYYYKVKSTNISGTSSYSLMASDATSDPTGVPDIPANLDANDLSSNAIVLTWNSAEDATSYYVYRATSSSGIYSKIATVKSRSYTDTGLTMNHTYYYKVKAYNSQGLSDYSNRAYATATADASIPDSPYDLNATPDSSGEIFLDWDTVDNATSYYIYRATSSSGTYTKIDTVYTEHYTDTSLSANTTYYYKVKAHNSYGTSDYSAKAYATTNYYGSSLNSSDRLAGQNRYDTSAKIAEKGWMSSYYAVIASGEDFPDALCGAPLAGKYNAPILLTSRYSLETQTKTQLSRLNVQDVFIIGGTGVISANVEQEIKNLGMTVTRISGENRYETSVKVAEKMGYVNQAVIATGDNFPDALSIASIAAIKGLPILLTAKDQLSEGVKKYLKDNVQSTIVVGGTGVVSNYIYNQLPSPTRLNGNNRYETNLNIVKAYVEELNFNTCYIATGEDFPDALAGSALASLNNSPIILVNNSISLSTIDFLSNRSVDHIVAFGGTGAVSDTVLLSMGSTTSVSNGVPSAPTNPSATSLGSDEIYLNWNSVDDATSYYIYRSTSSSGTYSKIDTVTSTSYYDTSLSEDTTYYYKIQAHNSSGTSAYSSRVYTTTEYGINLEAPSNLEAAALGSDEIYLTWNAVDYATSYYIYRATSSSGAYTKIATVYNEYYTNSNLTANRTYYYKVQAHNASETSNYSARAYVTTD